MNEKEFLKKLKRMRTGCGYSLAKVGVEMGHSISFYSHIEAGKTRLTVCDFLKLCEIFNIDPITFFMIGDEENFSFNRQKRLIEKIQKLPSEDVGLVERFLSPILKRNKTI